MCFNVFVRNEYRLLQMLCELGKLEKQYYIKKQPSDFRIVRIVSYSRVESWRSSWVLYLQLPLLKPDVRFSRIRLSNHLLPEAFAFTWPSSIASTWVLEIFGVNSVTAISFPSLLQKHDEGIAPFLSQSYVVLEIQAVLWATPTPFSTQWNFVSLYPPVAASAASTRVSRVHSRIAAPPLLPRKFIYRFW